MNKFFNKIRAWQSIAGDFHCSDCTIGSTDLTLYLANFITLAKQQGYVVPQDLYLNLINYLTNFSSQVEPGKDSYASVAQSILLLTENDYVTSNELQHLLQRLKQDDKKHWQKSLSGIYIAATYKLMKNDSFAKKIATTFLSSNRPLSARALSVVSNYFPSLAKQALTNKVIQQQVKALSLPTLSPLQAAYTVLALNESSKLIASGAKESLVTITGIDNSGNSQVVSSSPNIAIANITAETHEVKVQAKSPQGFYYQIIKAGYPKNPPNQAVKKGIESTIVLTDKSGHPVYNVKLGQLVHVQIRLRATGKAIVSRASVINLLPAGFQLVRSSLPTVGSNIITIGQDRLLFHLNIAPSLSTISYDLRAIDPGSYTFPPVVVQAYSKHSFNYARSLMERLTIQ